MRKQILALAILLEAMCSTTALADSYKPIIECEGGRVVVDQVFTDDPVYNHLQLVVHGTEFVRHIGSTNLGRFVVQYKNGERVAAGGDTLVFRVEKDALNPLPNPNKFFFRRLIFNGSQVQAVVNDFKDGNDYGGNYYFRNCLKKK